MEVNNSLPSNSKPPKETSPKRKIPRWGVFAIILFLIFLIFLPGSKVGAALGLSAVIGMVFFLVSLIVSAIKKKNKRADLIGLVTCFIVAIIAANAVPNYNKVSTASEVSSSTVSLTSAGQENYNKIKAKVESEAEASSDDGPIIVDYKTLHKEYQDNPINADEKYKGKQVTVTGSISKIDREINQEPYIIFEISPFNEIRMDFSQDKESDIASLKKGEKVTVTGTCEGTLLSTSVMLDDCSITE